MLKITEDEKKALKGRGIILSNDGEHFVVRVVSSNGVFTAEQLHVLSDAAEKYGNGKIAMTVRLTVEIQGVTYENIEPLAAAVEAAFAANPKSVADYASGKEKAFGFLVGQVMRALKGKADPRAVNAAVRQKLDSLN